MLDIKLPAAEKKRIREFTADIETVEKALAALKEAGIPAPGLESELAKVKKMQQVLLNAF